MHVSFLKIKKYIFQIFIKTFSCFKLRFLKALFYIRTSFIKGLLHLIRHPYLSVKNFCRFCLKCWERFLVTAFLCLLILYPLLALISEKIHDNSDFSGKAVEAGQMESFQTAAALIDREVNQYQWKANLPPIFPSALLDNMPSFQMGIIEALSFFIGAYSDEKLQRASEMLTYSGRIWYVNFSSHLKPMTPAQQSYRRALSLIKGYNESLKEISHPKTAKEFVAVLGAMQQSLYLSILKSQQRIELSAHQWIDFGSDNVFYKTKGKLYVNALLLRDLQEDYKDFIHDVETEVALNEALNTLTKAYNYNPWFILNGNPDGFLVPSHLSTQAFYAMQAKEALENLQSLVEEEDGDDD